MSAYLLLENGEIFKGKSIGYKGICVGEVVFNTSMSGYQEILTDPSYKGQIVAMTYPQIGNYGTNSSDMESKKPFVEGFIVKEMSYITSNFRSEDTLNEYLTKNRIVGIENIDTRKLTKIIREKGSLIGAITSYEEKIDEAKKLIDEYSIVGKDMVRFVTTKKPYEYSERLFRFDFENKINMKTVHNKRVVALDFGIKTNILRYLNEVGFNVVVMPAYSSYEEIKYQKPDALFLSNGPGDPRGVDDKWIIEYKKAIEEFPTFGICFGHQIIARCFDLKVYKMKFGHHGANHPVEDLESGTISVTAQNHNYAVDENSIKDRNFLVTHINLNDRTIEGMRHKELPLMSVQHHPEASPGPHDAKYLFERFAAMVENNQRSIL